MGHYVHTTMTVTGLASATRLAHSAAKSMGLSCSNIIASPLNGFASFMVGPSGSKTGEPQAAEHLKKLTDLVAMLLDQIKRGHALDFMVMRFGPDASGWSAAGSTPPSPNPTVLWGDIEAMKRQRDAEEKAKRILPNILVDHAVLDGKHAVNKPAATVKDGSSDGKPVMVTTSDDYGIPPLAFTPPLRAPSFKKKGKSDAERQAEAQLRNELAEEFPEM